MSKATALPTVPEPLALPLTLLSLVRCCLTSQPPFPVPHTSAPFLLTFVLNRKHYEWWRWWFIHNLITDFTFVHDHHKSISLLGLCHTKQLFFLNICANFSLSAKSRWQIFSQKKPKYSVAFGATLSATFRGKLGYFSNNNLPEKCKLTSGGFELGLSEYNADYWINNKTPIHWALCNSLPLEAGK